MAAASPDAVPVRRTEHCMGTVFSFDVRLPGVGATALDAAIAWLHQADATFSTYRDDSEISRLSHGEITLEQAAPDVRAVLARCAELEVETAGYFSARAAGVLDPSGLVKGWAIERASDLLVEAGSRSHSVNGGGDVQCAGDAGPGRPWRIGIADPADRARILAVVAGTDLAVATSGTAERGFHVIDPHTGTAAAGLASVTVAGRHLATADAYATAAFAMGESATDWLAALGEYRSFVVRIDGTTWASPGFDGS